MRKTLTGIAAVGAAVAAYGLVLRAADAPRDRYWPQWRGPEANGVARHANPPVEWSEQKNVRWKVEIPGRGSASPVIWGDQIFLLTAVPPSSARDPHAPRGGITPRELHRFVVLSIDRKTGKTIWERVANEATPHEASHTDNGTWASGSAVTDGEVVV